MGKMKKLTILLMFSSIVYAIDTYCATQSLVFHLFGFIFAVFCYYWYRKLIFFFQLKIKTFEENNMISSETRMNSICRLPVVWSNRLHYQSSPFLEACKRGDTALVKLMINSNVNIHETNIFGEGAIYLATFNLLKDVEKKDASCIWVLHNAGCSINLATKDGFTPLHLAAFRGHCPLISWLLKKGADINVEPSPAGVALVRGHKKAAALLLAHQYKIPVSNEKISE